MNTGGNSHSHTLNGTPGGTLSGASSRAESESGASPWVTRRAYRRTNCWQNTGIQKLLICTERNLRVIDALIALANVITGRSPARY